MELTVSEDFSFNMAAELVKKAPKGEKIDIYVKPGVYREKVSFVGDHISIIGEDVEKTVLEYGDYGLFFVEEEGVKLGTFRSYTLFVDGDDFTMKNITVKNTAGYGPKIGQAVALYMDGDRAQFENCRLCGRQDTLFTAPLPPSVIEKGGFRGPKEDAPRKDQTHHYRNCYIEGDVDFIFGGATAYFDDCEIRSLTRDNVKEGEIQGYVTAASTPEHIGTGYVFTRCRFTSDCPKGSVYLGRPWRNFAKVTVRESWIGEHIAGLGWHDWGKEEAHETTVYKEENNFGPGADTNERVKWMK